MADRERLRIAMVLPAVPPRQRRPQHAAADPHAARAPRSRLQRLDPRRDADAPVGVARRAALEPARVLRADRGARVQGLRRAGRAPTSSSRPAGRRSTRRCCSTPAERARTWSTTTSPSSTRPPSSARSPSGPTARACTASSASPWLRDLLAERYGAQGVAFQLGVEHDVYQPRPVARRDDTVIYYARHGTPRRAVPTGIAALARAPRAPPQHAHRPVRRREPGRGGVPLRASRRAHARASSRGCTRRRPSGCASR